MTPQEALGAAFLTAIPDETWESTYPFISVTAEFTEAILDALAADGWTVARTQDARDGEAMARLRDALPEGFGEVRSLWDDEDGWAVWTLHEDTDPDNPDAFGRGDTLDAAADACREAVEATRK